MLGRMSLVRCIKSDVLGRICWVAKIKFLIAERILKMQLDVTYNIYISDNHTRSQPHVTQ